MSKKDETELIKKAQIELVERLLDSCAEYILREELEELLEGLGAVQK